MTLSITVSDRFRQSAAEWGDARLMDDADALETKAEQALLEIEHLVSGATEVTFELDGETIHHEPSDDLEAFLEEQASAYGLDPDEVLALHVDLFARAFLEGETGGTDASDDPRPGH